MKTPTELGTNRTGLQTSPVHAKQMVQASQSVPIAPGDVERLLDVRVEYAREAGPIGTLPLPGTLKGAAKMATQVLKGEKATVLLDKLGERLAFERTGTRLYEGLVAKYDVHGTWPGGPSRDQLQLYEQQELAHFARVKQAMEALGADPTAITPSAAVMGVASLGLVQVISDVRTNLQQCLEAILVAELADNDGWQNLTRLARAMGHEEMAADFEQALREEDQHLASVRGWLMAGLERDARVQLEGASASPP